MTDVQTYGSLREKISAEKAIRKERYAMFERAYALAHEAGTRAGEACNPRPMVVTYTDRNGVVQKEFVADGVCGFAWIRIRPANSSFALWLKKTGKVSGRAYGGGVDIWVSQFDQSCQRKEAYARAFADVLNANGIKASAQSRLD
jgi:hypothetical protein